jgi:hypothetical protein
MTPPPFPKVSLGASWYSRTCEPTRFSIFCKAYNLASLRSASSRKSLESLPQASELTPSECLMGHKVQRKQKFAFIQFQFTFPYATCAYFDFLLPRFYTFKGSIQPASLCTWTPKAHVLFVLTFGHSTGL